VKESFLFAALMFVVSMSIFVECCSRAVFLSESRAALAEHEERECLRDCTQLVFACERVLDQCVEALGIPVTDGQ
jgi:hypothetical protein